MPERYTPGYSTNATNFMAKRNIDTHAAFFTPYLRPGMNLLDCGCGPGAIALGLAKAIFPGMLTGIDREVSQIQIAAESSFNQGISNANFLEANIYALPFPDNSFDAIFSHALFEHLQEPAQALGEMWRVLKPGGIVGLRSPDWGGFLIAPSTPELEKAFSYYKWLQQQNSGNPDVGRELRALLRQSGFTNIKASASYQCYEPLSEATEYLALRIEASAKVDGAIEKGWADEQSLTAMSRALREWSQHPDGFFAAAWCEVVGWKS
ncbi:methyltransferase domain-containing protein [Nostoc flagelliforme FACHB-838]|uniref:Methyltransferase domain-containing protein n=1 Tax=Nostoc flagelliforme FACHB-838 TaxID=2692904 RepID=A0ABR8DZU3_9NOSO|nr:methyltransferase domain-containing protein [Nostoc flagelliforme]MBD2534470.1 methyltransferase domain-containing protein [Nostoc flagelliforme FACHB-838]